MHNILNTHVDIWKCQTRIPRITNNVACHINDKVYFFNFCLLYWHSFELNLVNNMNIHNEAKFNLNKNLISLRQIA